MPGTAALIKWVPEEHKEERRLPRQPGLRALPATSLGKVERVTVQQDPQRDRDKDRPSQQQELRRTKRAGAGRGGPGGGLMVDDHDEGDIE